MSFEVNEDSTAIYTAIIRDETGAAIIKTSLSTLTLTLYKPPDGQIINSRNNQNVKDTNNVELDVDGTTGKLRWTMQPLDNVILGAWNPGQEFPDGRLERHVALFQWTYASGAKHGSHEVEIDVRNRQKIP